MKIKINHLLLAAFAVCIFVSCSSDDETPSSRNQAETLEMAPIESGKVLDNIVISGATKNTGAPATPNEAISFTLNKENTSAVMVDGFNIEFNSAAAVEGIYLQIKDTEGNIADGYYDIPVTSSGFKTAGIHQKINGNSRLSIQKTNTDEDVSVDVDFTSEIEPGTFCYEVCVYDVDGNISAPQEVCVTVESWAGNDDLIGEWSFTKQEITEDDETTTVNVGEENCESYELWCVNQDLIQYTECYAVDSFKLNLNADGTFTYEILATDNGINYDETYNTCQEVSASNDDDYSSQGNWAYDQENGELILVEFEYTTNEDGTTRTETYSTGNAEVVKLAAVVNGNNLILTEEYVDDNIVTETYKYYFNK